MARLLLVLPLLAALVLAVAAGVMLARALRGPSLIAAPTTSEVSMPGSVRAISYVLLLLLLLGVTSGWLGPA